jgi:hypothetical protein
VDTVTVLVSQRVGPANAEGLCPVCEQLCQKTAIEHERAHAIVLHVRATQPLTPAAPAALRVGVRDGAAAADRCVYEGVVRPEDYESEEPVQEVRVAMIDDERAADQRRDRTHGRQGRADHPHP